MDIQAIVALSASGQVVVLLSGSQPRLRRIGSSDLAIPELNSFAALSGDGGEVAGALIGQPPFSGIWSPETGVIEVPAIPAEWGSWYITDLSFDGSVVLGYVGYGNVLSSGRHSFLRRVGGSSDEQIDIPLLLPDDRLELVALDSAGTRAVGSSYASSGVSRAVVWDPAGGVRTVVNELTGRGLELEADLELGQADFLSDDGRKLVGRAGDDRFWVVTLEE